MNPRSLIQQSEILSIELTRTHHISLTFSTQQCNNSVSMSSWMSSSKPHPTELVIYPTSHPLCTQHVRISSGFVGSLSPSKSFESGSQSRTRTQKSCVILFDTFQHQTKRPLLPKLKIYPLWLLMVKATCKIQMVSSGNTNTYIPTWYNLWFCMAYTQQCCHDETHCFLSNSIN